LDADGGDPSGLAGSNVNKSEIKAGDLIWVREYLKKEKWAAGIVLGTLGEHIYKVKLDSGRLTNAHIDQIKKRKDFGLRPRRPQTPPQSN
jgi:hypothetical protein